MLTSRLPCRRLFLALSLLPAAALAQDPPACPERLLVSGYYSGVHVYDACTGTYLRDLDPRQRIKGAQAVKIGPDGMLYVVSEESHEILKYDPASFDFRGVAVTLGPGVGATGLEFGPAGELWIAAYKTSEIRRYDAAGKLLPALLPSGKAGLAGADNGMLKAPDGKLYVPGFDSHSYVRFDPATGETAVAVPAGTAGLKRSRGILPATDGQSLLLTGEGSGQILRYRLSDGAVSEFAKGLIKPTGITWLGNGELAVVDGGAVVRLDPQTGVRKGVLVTPGSGGLKGPTYLAVIPAPATAAAAGR